MKKKIYLIIILVICFISLIFVSCKNSKKHMPESKGISDNSGPVLSTDELGNIFDETLYQLSDETEIISPDSEPAIKLEFKKPKSSKYMVLKTVNDVKTGEWAVVYVVSAYASETNIPGTYSAEHTHIQIQIFNKDADFIKHIDTQLPSYARPEYNPEGIDELIKTIRFDDGLLTFISTQAYSPLFVFLRTEEETYIKVPTTMYTQYNDYCIFTGIGEEITDNDEYYAQYEFSLYKRDKLEKLVSLPIEDARLISGIESHTLTFDNKNLTAVYGNDKIKYTVNFNSGDYSVSREYNDDLMDLLLAKSRDGRYEAYIADLHGESHTYGDLVVKDVKTGIFTFLKHGYYLDAAFGPDNELLACDFFNTAIYDIKTKELLNKKLLFDSKKNIILGCAYDTVNERYILSFRDYADDEDMNEYSEIKLKFYDKNAAFLKDASTGVKILKSHNYFFNTTEITIDYKTGEITFSDNGETLGVYIEK